MPRKRGLAHCHLWKIKLKSKESYLSKNKAVIVAVCSDLHTNSTVGLRPATQFLRDDGDASRPSAVQRWMWRNWIHYVGRVKAASERHDNAPVITVFNGDLFDGDHHDTTQIITRNEADMMRLAWETLRPLVEVSDKIFLTRGTPSHVGKAAKMEEMIGRDIGAVPTKTERYTWNGLRIVVSGVHIWAAHHASMGRLPWTRRNAANKLAATTVFKCAEQKIRPPDVIFRSHMHQWGDSYDNYPVRGVYLPGWQLPTEYVYRLDGDATGEFGGVIMVCEDGKYTLEKERYVPAPDKPMVVRFDERDH